jgi:hypothetical protein
MKHGTPGAAKPQPKKQNHRCTPIHTDSQKQPEKFAKPSQILDDSSMDSWLPYEKLLTAKEKTPCQKNKMLQNAQYRFSPIS